MKNKILLWIFLTLFFIGFLFVLYPIIYWFNHDYLTKMQVFKQFWYFSISGILLMVPLRYIFS